MNAFLYSLWNSLNWLCVWRLVSLPRLFCHSYKITNCNSNQVLIITGLLIITGHVLPFPGKSWITPYEWRWVLNTADSLVRQLHDGDYQVHTCSKRQVSTGLESPLILDILRQVVTLWRRTPRTHCVLVSAQVWGWIVWERLLMWDLWTVGSLQWDSWVTLYGTRRWSEPPSLHSSPTGSQSADCQHPEDGDRR